MKPTIQQPQSSSQITVNQEPMSRPQYGSASPKPKLGGGVGRTSSGARKPSLNAPAPSQSFRRPSITSMTSMDRTNDFITGTNTNHSAAAIQRRRAPHLVQERIDHFTSINNVTNLSKSPASVLLSTAQKQKQQQQQQQLSTIRNSSISGDHVLSPILAQDVTDHNHQGGQGLHTHFLDEGETGFDDMDHPQDGNGGDGKRGGDRNIVRDSNEEEAININTTTTATSHTTVTATPSRNVDMQRPRPPPMTMTSMSFMSSAQPQQQQYHQYQHQQRREEITSATIRRTEATPAADGGAMAAHRQQYHYTPAPSSSSSSKLPGHNNTQHSSLLWQQQQQQQQKQGSDLTMYELEASHMVNDRLEDQLEDLRAEHAREMEKVLTKLAGLQSENDELGVENAALAAALLHDDSVALLRRVTKSQAQGGDPYGSVGDRGHESHSKILGHQYQQRQQRDCKVSAATAALLELQELVLAAADRAQPQLQLEQEAARERATNAREIEHLKTTIERMQVTNQQRVEESNAVVQGLEITLQEMYEQMEAKELGIRKAAKDVASLRADCQRLSQSSEQWQGRYEDLLTSSDHTVRDLLQQHSDKMAALEASHRTEAATWAIKNTALDQALAVERAAGEQNTQKLGSDLALLREQTMARTLAQSDLTRQCEQKSQEIESLQRKIKAMENSAEQASASAEAAQRQWESLVSGEKELWGQERQRHDQRVADLQGAFDAERSVWVSEKAALEVAHEASRQSWSEERSQLKDVLETERRKWLEEKREMERMREEERVEKEATISQTKALSTQAVARVEDAAAEQQREWEGMLRERDEQLQAARATVDEVTQRMTALQGRLSAAEEGAVRVSESAETASSFAKMEIARNQQETHQLRQDLAVALEKVSQLEKTQTQLLTAHNDALASMQQQLSAVETQLVDAESTRKEVKTLSARLDSITLSETQLKTERDALVVANASLLLQSEALKTANEGLTAQLAAARDAHERGLEIAQSTLQSGLEGERVERAGLLARLSAAETLAHSQVQENESLNHRYEALQTTAERDKRALEAVIAELEETLSREVQELSQDIRGSRQGALVEESMWQEMAKEAGARCVDIQTRLDQATAAWTTHQEELDREVSTWRTRAEEQTARLEEQAARIEALNEEWASVQEELSMVEMRWQTTMQEKAVAETRAERQISQLQDDLNAYVGESDLRDEEHAQAMETMQATYRQEKERLLDTIQQFVTEIDFWRVQALHFQELAHRIPSNYFTLPNEKDKEKEKGKSHDQSLEMDRDRDRGMSQGREEEKEASGGTTTTAMAPRSSSSLMSSSGGGMTMLASPQPATTSSSASSSAAAMKGEMGVTEVAESKTHLPFSPIPSHLPSPAPVPSLYPPHARRQELALALVSSPVSQQSHQYAAAQLAAKSLEDALEAERGNSKGFARKKISFIAPRSPRNYEITEKSHDPLVTTMMSSSLPSAPSSSSFASSSSSSSTSSNEAKDSMPTTATTTGGDGSLTEPYFDPLHHSHSHISRGSVGGGSSSGSTGGTIVNRFVSVTRRALITSTSNNDSSNSSSKNSNNRIDSSPFPSSSLSSSLPNPSLSPQPPLSYEQPQPLLPRCFDRYFENYFESNNNSNHNSHNNNNSHSSNNASDIIGSTSSGGGGGGGDYGRARDLLSEYEVYETNDNKNQSYVYFDSQEGQGLGLQRVLERGDEEEVGMGGRGGLVTTPVVLMDKTLVPQPPPSLSELAEQRYAPPARQSPVHEPAMLASVSASSSSSQLAQSQSLSLSSQLLSLPLQSQSQDDEEGGDRRPASRPRAKVQVKRNERATGNGGSAAVHVNNNNSNSNSNSNTSFDSDLDEIIAFPAPTQGIGLGPDRHSLPQQQQTGMQTASGLPLTTPNKYEAFISGRNAIPDAKQRLAMAKGKLRPTTNTAIVSTTSDPMGDNGVGDVIDMGQAGYEVGGLTRMTTQPQLTSSSSHPLHPATTTYHPHLHPATPLSTSLAQGPGLALPLARGLVDTQVVLTDFSPPVLAPGPGLGPGLGLRHPADDPSSHEPLGLGQPAASPNPHVALTLSDFSPRSVDFSEPSSSASVPTADMISHDLPDLADLALILGGRGFEHKPRVEEKGLTFSYTAEDALTLPTPPVPSSTSGPSSSSSSSSSLSSSMPSSQLSAAGTKSHNDPLVVSLPVSLATSSSSSLPSSLLPATGGKSGEKDQIFIQSSSALSAFVATNTNTTNNAVTANSYDMISSNNNNTPTVVVNKYAAFLAKTSTNKP